MKNIFLILISLLFCKESSDLEHLNDATNKNLVSNKNNLYYVTSESGLIVRSEPSIKSKSIGLIKFKEEVALIGISSEDKVNELKGNWIKIEFNDSIGYIFNAYISEHKFYNEIKKVYNNKKNAFYIFETPKSFEKSIALCDFGVNYDAIVRVIKKGKEVFYNIGHCPNLNGFLNDELISVYADIVRHEHFESEELVFDIEKELFVSNIKEKGYAYDDLNDKSDAQFSEYIEERNICNFGKCMNLYIRKDNTAIIKNENKLEEIKFQNYEIIHSREQERIYIDSICWMEFKRDKIDFMKCSN